MNYQHRLHELNRESQTEYDSRAQDKLRDASECWRRGAYESAKRHLDEAADSVWGSYRPDNW